MRHILTKIFLYTLSILAVSPAQAQNACCRLIRAGEAPAPQIVPQIECIKVQINGCTFSDLISIDFQNCSERIEVLPTFGLDIYSDPAVDRVVIGLNPEDIELGDHTEPEIFRLLIDLISEAQSWRLSTELTLSTTPDGCPAEPQDPEDEDPEDENPEDENPEDENPEDEDPEDENPEDEDPYLDANTPSCDANTDTATTAGLCLKNIDDLGGCSSNGAQPLSILLLLNLLGWIKLKSKNAQRPKEYPQSSNRY